MTLGGVKSSIRFELSADRAIKEESFNTLIYRAMKDVCIKCEPLSLCSSGIGGGEVLRFIDDVNYVRKPNEPVDDSDILDIDDMLENAVVYAACMILSRDHKADYEVLFNKAVNDFQWAIYEGESNVLTAQEHHYN